MYVAIEVLYILIIKAYLLKNSNSHFKSINFIGPFKISIEVVNSALLCVYTADWLKAVPEFINF